MGVYCMKKFVSLLLALAMMLSLLSVAAFAASGDFDDGLGDWDSTNPCGKDLVWSLVDGVLTISGSGAMTDWTTSAQDIPWLADKGEVTKVVVCDGVTSIGGRAFQDMDALACVILPETLKSVGAYAFDGCDALDAVCFVGTEAQWSGVSVPNSAGLKDKTFYAVTQIGDHWIAHVEAIDAACETDGNIEYWFCPDCGAYFADANAETPITEDAVIVEGFAHEYENGICTVCCKADPDADIKVVSFGADLGAANRMGAAYADGKLIGMFESVSVDGSLYAAIPTALYKKMDTAKLFQLDAYYAPVCGAGVFEK